MQCIREFSAWSALFSLISRVGKVPFIYGIKYFITDTLVFCVSVTNTCYFQRKTKAILDAQYTIHLQRGGIKTPDLPIKK